MKKAITAVCAIVALFGVLYLASPLLGYYRLQEAARSGDQDALEGSVDFPAVRENLKAQLNAGFAAKFQSDPKLKGNPFAGLGMVFATALIGKMVDSFLTPEGISAMVTRAKTPRSGASVVGTDGLTKVKLEKHYSYINLDRVRVIAVDPAAADKPLSFVLERRGLFGWKLIRIELPAALFG